MKLYSKILVFVLLAGLLSSCYFVEDPGPLQEAEKSFSLTGFDRLEMGNAFIITVEQGETFSIIANGDSRNIDDLDVYKKGTTLVVKFDKNRDNRKHDTYITVTMPVLEGVKFSGASSSTISGFDTGNFNFSLSGASHIKVDLTATSITGDISGASRASFTGTTHELDVEVSGASELKAFDLVADHAHLYVSGVSKAKVNVTGTLYAKAGGASTVRYLGSPEVTKNTSGASSVEQE